MIKTNLYALNNEKKKNKVFSTDGNRIGCYAFSERDYLLKYLDFSYSNFLTIFKSNIKTHVLPIVF